MIFKVFVCGKWSKKHDCIRRLLKFVACVMVFACMTADGPGRLCLVNDKIDFEVYQEIFEKIHR